MKRLLLPLLAALALPTAVNAESYWLLIRGGYPNEPAFEKIEMKDSDQCEEMGALFMSSSRLNFSPFEDKKIKRRGFECFEGK